MNKGMLILQYTVFAIQRICNSIEILNRYFKHPFRREIYMDLTQRANLRKYNVRQIQMVHDKPS